MEESVTIPTPALANLLEFKDLEELVSPQVEAPNAVRPRTSTSSIGIFL